MKKQHIAHSDDAHFEESVKELLLYRKIVKVEQYGEMGELTLDNGTVLIVEGNKGCGACSNGWYDLIELNSCDNAITDVRCTCELDECDNDVYHIFVFAENKMLNAVQYEGHDNGYYGTGFDLYVKLAD